MLLRSAKYGVEGVEKLVEMIDADALAIHLNFLQEAIQPEGDRDATGCLDTIREICSVLGTPVIVKETGAGISREDALLLQKAGVSAIDVGGVGGTSWAGVEVYRARESGDSTLRTPWGTLLGLWNSNSCQHHRIQGFPSDYRNGRSQDRP